MFIVEQCIDLVQRWVEGDSAGTTIAGNNDPGSADNQLNDAYDVL
jgi:hypothetical protein